MWKQSVWTSTISSHLATKHLKDGGLLTLSGARACLEGTPGKINFINVYRCNKTQFTPVHLQLSVRQDF